MITRVVDVTPVMAADWLKNNRHNTEIDPAVVECLAEIMRNNLWDVRYPGIAIGRDGRLINGQHRLSAVVLTGMTVPMYVTFGYSVWVRP
jgi:hypothetical protein